jgi:hypothetical protein
MSDTTRWIYGETNPVFPAVDSATVIEMGDLLYQDTDDAKPASMQVDTGPRSHQAKQMEFADNFLGVAMQRSRSGDTNPIRVATTGVFEFDCPSGTFELGDLMGTRYLDIPLSMESEPQDRPIRGLANQEVASVSASIYAIGRVAKRVATAATAVLIDIRSTVMTGGIKGSSPSGV